MFRGSEGIEYTRGVLRPYPYHPSLVGLIGKSTLVSGSFTPLLSPRPRPLTRGTSARTKKEKKDLQLWLQVTKFQKT